MARRRVATAKREGRTEKRGESASDAARPRAAATPAAKPARAGKRETQSIARREAILAAALDEFAARGF